ncbi:carboxypeptidase regulatory-like domain-containing protein [Flavobacterium sp. RHBU_3]|uniref:carboxypeptidase regulatory-like domain-containing protein n=1 Tax=Flavobacterium sp. RHBU_3 TaxID=3391184 RepID=UPI00398539FA
MKNFFFGLVLLLCAAAHSQTIKFEGTIKDSTGTALEMANIMAVNKATNAMDSYAITDEKGRYVLNLKPNTTYGIKASFIGYDTFEQTITTENANVVKNITLTAGVQLKELEIVHEMPVSVKGDTLVYNSDSFTNGTERKLEDVLKKLPGVEVDSDGNVKVEGKTVTKLMVEGKDFFDGDTKLGVKNIPADALDKVEVLRNYNEVGQMKGLVNNEENVAMNIKLKEGKKNFWFGDLTAGGGEGNGGRYILNPKLFYYSPLYSVNLIGNFNNTGELPLTMQDYFKMTGGFRNFMKKGGTNFNVSTNNLGISLLRNNRAKNIETKFGAANFSFNPSKAWSLSGFAIINSGRNELETQTRNTILDPVTLETQTVQDTKEHTLQRSDFSMVKLSSSYKPSTRFQFDYDGFFKISKQGEDTQLMSTVSPQTDQSQDIATAKNQTPFSINQNLNLYYTADDKNVFSFEGQHLYQEEDPFYRAVLEYNPFPGSSTGDQSLNLNLADATLYNLNQRQLVITNKTDAKADWYYLLTPKANINLTLGDTYSYQQFNSNLFQILDSGDMDNLDDNSKNNVRYSFNDVFLGLHYKFIAGKFTFNPGFSVHSFTMNNDQLGTSVGNNFYRVLPDVYALYQIKKSERLLYTYTVTNEFSDISKYARGLVLNNYSSLFRGNRNLESATYQTHNLNYFRYVMFNFTQIFANLSYSKRANDVKTLAAYSGINQVSTVENSNFADEIVNGMAGYNRTFERFYKASVSANLSWNRYNNFRADSSVEDEVTMSNALRQVTEQFTQSYTASLGTIFKEWPNLELGYSMNINSYTGNKTYTHSPYARMDYLLFNNITITADYTYNHYYNNTRTSDNEYDFLNASVMYLTKNKVWEFKVSGTNLLNTTSLNDDSFNQFSTRISRYTVQPRYLMFTVKYNIM